MTIQWQGKTLWITRLSVPAMGRLAACIPAGREETQVLAALLVGARVCALREGLEYRQFRKCAPAGAYRRLMALERTLREMGVIVVRNGGGKSLGDQKIGPPGRPELSARAPDGGRTGADLR